MGRAASRRKFIRFCLQPEQQALYSNHVANAPTNTKAFDFISPGRATRLATSPTNIAHIHPRDDFWWSENRKAVAERFAKWLLS